MFHAAGLRVRFGLLDGARVDVAALHLSSFTGVKFLALSFIVYCYIFIVLLLSASVDYL